MKALKMFAGRIFESLREKHPKCKDLPENIMVFLEVDMEFIGEIDDQ